MFKTLNTLAKNKFMFKKLFSKKKKQNELTEEQKEVESLLSEKILNGDFKNDVFSLKMGGFEVCIYTGRVEVKGFTFFKSEKLLKSINERYVLERKNSIENAIKGLKRNEKES